MTTKIKHNIYDELVSNIDNIEKADEIYEKVENLEYVYITDLKVARRQTTELRTDMEITQLNYTEEIIKFMTLYFGCDIQRPWFKNSAQEQLFNFNKGIVEQFNLDASEFAKLVLKSITPLN